VWAACFVGVADDLLCRGGAWMRGLGSIGERMSETPSIAESIAAEAAQRSWQARARLPLTRKIADCAIETYIPFYHAHALERKSPLWEASTRRRYEEKHGMGLITSFVLGAIIHWVVIMLLNRLVEQPGFNLRLEQEKANRLHE
jgi:hypothetical protein